MTQDSIPNTRRRILRDLRDFSQHVGGGPDNYVQPDSLRSFRVGDKTFLAAINELLGQGLILGVAGSDKRVAIRLNYRKIDEINKELSEAAWYADPKFVIPTIIAIVAAAAAIVAYFVPMAR